MTIKRTDIILDDSVPDFIRSEYPYFADLLEAYYDWLAEEKGPLDVLNADYRDIDSTLDEFVEYFRNEYLVDFPFDLDGDKRLLIKRIKEFYQNKGNESSLRFLFRILYGEDIEFYYPKVDILRASDGKWQQNVTVKIVQDEDISTDIFFSNNVVGLTSNALGTVENISVYTERGIAIYELTFQNVRGIFQANEVIQIGEYYTTVLEVASSIQINEGGSGYSQGEIIQLIEDGNIIGTGEITSTGRGPVTGLTILEGGIGYNGDERQVEDFQYLPVNTTWEGIYILEATIAGDSNQFDFESSPVSFVIDTTLIPGEGDIINITDTPTQVGVNAIGRVSLVSQEGEILEVELISGGRDYNTPIASVSSETGTGAEIQPLGGGSSIQTVKLNNFPLAIYDSNGRKELSINILTEAGMSADLELLYSAGTIKYPGFWANDDGKLSSNKVLQDNFYYQDFSYEILTSVSSSKWKEIIEKLSHPAGFELFGYPKVAARVRANSNYDADATITTG